MFVDHDEKQKILTSLLRLGEVVDRIKNVSADVYLVWQKDEISSWINFLESHSDKDEIRSLEREIADRFYNKYAARFVPFDMNLDKLDIERLKIFEAILNDMDKLCS